LDATSRSAHAIMIPPCHEASVYLELCQRILVRPPGAERHGRQRCNGRRRRARRSNLLQAEADPLARVRLPLALAIRSWRAVPYPVVLDESLGDPLVDIDRESEGRIRTRTLAVAGSRGGECAHHLGIGRVVTTPAQLVLDQGDERLDACRRGHGRCP